MQAIFEDMLHDTFSSANNLGFCKADSSIENSPEPEPKRKVSEQNLHQLRYV